MPAKRKSVRKRPRGVIGNAVHIGQIAVGELPHDIRPDERMQAKLLMEAQAIVDGREAELKAALALETKLAVGDSLRERILTLAGHDGAEKGVAFERWLVETLPQIPSTGDRPRMALAGPPQSKRSSYPTRLVPTGSECVNR